MTIGFLVLGVLSGLAQWGGRSPHPAVVNPVCGQDAQAVVSLDGEWDFTTCEREGGSEQYHRNGNCSRFYEIAWKNAVKVRVPSCWEAQGVGEPGESECWAIGWDASVKPLRHKFMGSGWYRRSVRIPSAWQGRRVWIKLGGVKSAGYVWVNGRQVALTQNYCATEKYEITDLVTPGQTARVAIQADNRIPSCKGLMSHTHCFGGVYRSVELVALGTVGGEPNVRLGWWWMGRQMGMALAEHPVLRHLPHEGVLSPLLFRIVREGRPLPVDGLTASDLIVVGEGGEACYTYLAERRHPNGARELLVNGLDLLADTPEGNALLLGAVEELAAQTVR